MGRARVVAAASKVKSVNAVVDLTATSGYILTPDGNSMPQAHDRLSLTAVQRDGRWLLIHGHNAIINPQAANNDPVLRMPKG